MRWRIAGMIEGFYGQPWSWDERLQVVQACAARGMTHYVYAPKDDPKHRAEWRVPYTEGELAGFERLVEGGGLTVGFAISPGLSMRYGDDEDRATLAAKIDQVVARGVGLVCLALDDIPRRPGLGSEHAAVTTWLREHLGDRVPLVLVPTDYVGTSTSDYLDHLVAGLPDDVPVAWTGVSVVNDAITADQARQRAESLAGRPPLLWDNYPVNDVVMSDRLFLGPLRGRDPALVDECSGYLANPMQQPRCSLLPLASIAAWLRGEAPEAAWQAEADGAGLRVFAEACDGELPRALVAALAAVAGAPGAEREARLEALAAWLTEAASCDAPGLEGEADRWLDQVRAEAAAGGEAVRLLRRAWGAGAAGDPDHAEKLLTGVFGVAMRWQAVRRSDVTVLGPRWAFRPAITQADSGGWRLRPGALQENANALDALCRLALAAAT